MAVDYHGPLPVTTQDKKMAKKHLTASKQLLQSKISDHESAKEDAQEGGNEASESYNDSHLVSHKKDLAKVNTSLKTLSNQAVKGDNMATPIKKTGSTGGQPNTPGGGGRFKQMVAKTGSPALAAFIGRKKYGAKAMSKMSASGRK